MKIVYDSEVDALSIRFRDTTVTTKHLAEGIAADYDAAGKLVGLEILDAQKRFGSEESLRRVSLEGFSSVEAPLAVYEKPPEYGK
jgi:uncharacterized protein YuzE